MRSPTHSYTCHSTAKGVSLYAPYRIIPVMSHACLSPPQTIKRIHCYYSKVRTMLIVCIIMLINLTPWSITQRYNHDCLVSNGVFWNKWSSSNLIGHATQSQPSVAIPTVSAVVISLALPFLPLVVDIGERGHFGTGDLPRNLTNAELSFPPVTKVGHIGLLLGQLTLHLRTGREIRLPSI